MKLHKLVNVLGALNDTNKLASDMYDLGKKHYYSESHGQKIPISEMDFQHLVRSFIKLCDQEEMLDRSKHMGTTKELVAKIERLESIIEEKDELIDKWSEAEHRWRKAYQDVAHTKGHYYSFCEIPNNAEGKDFIAKLREYLNKDSYKMRVRGQHLKEELYGQGKAYHGQSIEDSTHLRVYLDRK